MNEFVFLYRGSGNMQSDRSPEVMEASMKRWQAWFDKLSEEGKLKDRGIPLLRESKYVAAGGTILDGPFAEGKEVIGGISIIKAKDLADAAEIAKGCPVFEAGGSVEVRPIAPM